MSMRAGGYYLIRSNDSNDSPTVAGSTASAVLPGPAPGLGADPFGTSYEIPLAIQDRSFNADGSLFYPDTRAFFDDFVGPYVPATDVAPIWNPEFFGNCMVVNGRTWPYLDVEPRRYRFRLLNGCQSRFLILKFSDPKADVWQIGCEGGFLRAPVRLTEILMSPAERADVIVDFSKVKVGTNLTLLNRGPDAPFGGGGFRRDDPQSTGLVMQFRLRTLVNADNSTPPDQLVMPTLPEGTGGSTRSLALLDDVDVGRGPHPGDGASRHVRSDFRSTRWPCLQQMGRPGDGKPDTRFNRGMGALQLHGRCSSDTRP